MFSLCLGNSARAENLLWLFSSKQCVVSKLFSNSFRFRLFFSLMLFIFRNVNNEMIGGAGGGQE